MSPLQHKIYLKVFGQSQNLPFAKGRHLALFRRCRYDLLIWGYMYPQKWWFATLPIKQPRRFIMGLLVQGWHMFPSWIAAVSDGFSSQSLSHSCIPKPKVNRTSHPQDWCNMPNKNGTHPQNHPQTKNTWHDFCHICNCGQDYCTPQKDTARERTKLLNIIWCTLHECSDEIANILGPWIAPILTQLSGAPWSPSIPLTSWLTTSWTII